MHTMCGYCIHVEFQCILILIAKSSQVEIWLGMQWTLRHPLLLLQLQHFRLSAEAVEAFGDYIARRRQLPFFANARSIRNALDRARLRQANRLFARMDEALTKEDLITLEAPDIRASRVFQWEVEGHHLPHAASG